MNPERLSPTTGLEEAERGYLYQLAQLADTTLPRARYILEQHRAILPDTAFNRGCIRATAEYVRTAEAEVDAEPEAGN